MSTNTTMSNYTSYESLRAAHMDLLRLQRKDGETDSVLQGGRLFVRLARATGVILDDDNARDSAQSMINYWVTTLYSAGIEVGETYLSEFDESQAPDLKDVACPYRGLSAFSENDDGVFFGRQKLVGMLLEHLKDRRLLAVAGPSGSGKSSVVRAGVIPALIKGGLPGSKDWVCLPAIVPGSHPLLNLAQLFCRDNSEAELQNWVNTNIPAMLTDQKTLASLVGQIWNQNVVFVVDQFEEAFTLCEDEAERNAFVANLQFLTEEPNHQHRLILTMRSDFENKVALLPNFQPVFEANLVRVVPLAASELRQAIEEPAHRVGLKFEAGVVESLVGDVLGEPAALPLLQFSLLQLWEKRERNRVTLAAYRRVGGGREALERAADALYGSFIEQYKTATRLILLRLVQPTAGLEVTSRRVRRSELYVKSVSADSINHTLERLQEAQLLRLTPGRRPEDDQVEVAHEALVRNWRTLVEWLDKERDRIRQRQHLTMAAEQWQEYHRDPDLLLRGVELAAVKDYDDLTKLEAEFIETSNKTEETERLQAENEARRLRRLNRSLAISAMLAIFISLLAFYLGFKSSQEGKRAEAESTKAVAQAANAQIAEGKAKANAETAVAAQATSAAQQAISFAQAQALATANIEAQNKTFLLSTAEAKSKQDALTAKSKLLGMLAAQLIEQRNKLDLSLLLGISAVNASADVFEARNSLISSLHAEPRLLKFIWDMKEPIAALESDPQSNILAAVSKNGELALWDTSVPTDLKLLFYNPASSNIQAGKNITETIAFSPDGRWLAVFHEGRKTVIEKQSEPLSAQLDIWDIRDPKNPIAIIQQPLALTSTVGISSTTSITTTISDLAFSPDGSLLASADQLGQVTLWNISPPDPIRPIHTWQAHFGKVTSLAFLTSTQAISYTQATILVTAGCMGAQINLATLPEGVNPCSQGDVVTWDVSNPRQPKPIGGLLKASGTFYAEAFVYSGDYYFHSGALATGINLLAVSDNYQNITLVDLTDPQLPITAGNYYPYAYSESGTGNPGSLAISQNGQRLAVSNSSGNLNVVAINTNPPDQVQVGYTTESLQFLPVFDTPETLTALDADGTTLFTSNPKAKLQVWNVDKTISWANQTWQTYQTFYGFSVAFHPTRPLIATNHYNGGIRLWDFSDPKAPLLLSPSPSFAHDSSNILGRLDFNLTGDILIYSGYHVELWDVRDPKHPQPIPLPPALQETISMKTAAKFSPVAENVFAVGNDAGKIQFWQINDFTDVEPLGKPISPFSSRTSPIKEISLSRDGQRLAVFNMEGEFTLWDISNLSSMHAFATTWQVVTEWNRDNEEEIISLRGDGQVLLVVGCSSSCLGPTLQIWDYSNPSKPKLAKQLPVLEHPDGIYSLAYSPDGKMGATSDKNGKVVLWDFTDITRPQQIGEPLFHSLWVDQVAFDITGQHLAAISDDTSTTIYKITQAGAQFDSQIWPLPIFRQFDGLISGSDDTHLFSFHQGNLSGGINIWHLPESIPLASPSISKTIYITATRMATSPDGSILAAASSDGQVTLWDTTNQLSPQLKVTWVLPEQTQVTGLAFSPTQSWLATSSSDHFLRVWDFADPETPRLAFAEEVSNYSLGEIAFSSDGKFLITAICAANPAGDCNDVGVQVYGFNNPPGLEWIDEKSLSPGNPILQILPQPGGTMLAILNQSWVDLYATGYLNFLSVGSDGRLTNVGETWQGQYARLAFRKDGRLLALGFLDGTIKLADVEIGQPARPPRLYALTFYFPIIENSVSQITGLAFAEGGNVLVSTSFNTISAQRIDFAQITSSNLVEMACNLVNRNLTPEEWNFYFPDSEYEFSCPEFPQFHPS
jgi:WD40 repeat protein